MDIKIESQDGMHQYDAGGNAITTWDAKRCAWIVNPPYEKSRIDWYGRDSDFPGGTTLAQFNEDYPNFDKNPEIDVTFFWDTKGLCIATFGTPDKFQGIGSGYNPRYWDDMKYPYTAHKNWNYIEDVTKEDAVERFGKYCDFHRNASRVLVKFNGEVLHDGPLK